MDSLFAKKHAGEECVICEEAKTKGIHLYTSFICTDCENKRTLVNRKGKGGRRSRKGKQE